MNNPFNFLSSIYNINLSSRLSEILKNQSTKLEDVMDEDVLYQDYKDNKPAVLE
jgi:hypothetical protein